MICLQKYEGQGSLKHSHPARRDHPDSWKNAPRMLGHLKSFLCGFPSIPGIAPGVAPRIVVVFVLLKSRDFEFREWNFEFREPLRETPELSKSCENGLFFRIPRMEFRIPRAAPRIPRKSPRAPSLGFSLRELFFPEIGVVPRLLIPTYAASVICLVIGCGPGALVSRVPGCPKFASLWSWYSAQKFLNPGNTKKYKIPLPGIHPEKKKKKEK